MHNYEKDFDEYILSGLKDRQGLTSHDLDFADTVTRHFYCWVGEHTEGSKETLPATKAALKGLAQCMTLLITRDIPVEWKGTMAEVERAVLFMRIFNEKVTEAFGIEIVHMSLGAEKDDDDEDRLD
jgi:hypothetical protein